MSLRNKFASLQELNSLEWEDWPRVINSTFYQEIESLYKQAVQDGLDFMLDREAKSIKHDLEDFVERLTVHRDEVKAVTKERRDLELARRMQGDSRILYIILETPKEITRWLTENS